MGLIQTAVIKTAQRAFGFSALVLAGGCGGPTNSHDSGDSYESLATHYEKECARAVLSFEEQIGCGVARYQSKAKDRSSAASLYVPPPERKDLLKELLDGRVCLLDCSWRGVADPDKEPPIVSRCDVRIETDFDRSQIYSMKNLTRDGPPNTNDASREECSLRTF